MLLSVDWGDLLTPYSEFVRNPVYEVSAGRILLDAEGLPQRIEPVKPVPLASPRRIGVRHFLWGFPDPEAAAAAVPKLAAFMRRAGLSDFVLVESQSNNPHIQACGFLYFAQQELRFDEYLPLIRRNLPAASLRSSRAASRAWWRRPIGSPRRPTPCGPGERVRPGGPRSVRPDGDLTPRQGQSVVRAGRSGVDPGQSLRPIRG